MTTSGAYEGEMGRFLGLSDEELSRLLAGEAGVRDEAFDEVASLLGEVRQVFATAAPSDGTREGHLAAIAEASHVTAEKGNPAARPVSKVRGPVDVQVSELPKWRKVMNRTTSLALRVTAGVIAASTSMIGLAYAGVDLPGQAAEHTLEAVTGLELPNQDSDEGKSVADDVRSVTEGDLEGCERGQAVADAADANRQDETANDVDPCEQDEGDNEAKGSRATGEEKSAAGRAKAAEKSGGRSESAGSDAANDGRTTGADKSDGASDAGSDNAGTQAGSGADNAGTNDDAGRTKSEGASSSGSSDAGSDNAGTNDDKGGTTGEEASSIGSDAADVGAGNAGQNAGAGPRK